MREPFFVVGAPRSGTTLLRDLLRQHPILECPEETSFYRWSDSFGTKAYTRTYRRNAVVCEHREKDGFSNKEFWEIYQKAKTRRQLQDLYMEQFIIKRGNPDGRWFEKTPQHSAGLLRLLCDYPDARIIHLYRSPLNVVASIKEGNTVGPQNVRGAANIWLEAVQGAQLVSQQWPDKIYQVRYEDMTVSPESVIAGILDFVKVPPFTAFPAEPRVWPMNLRYLERLKSREVDKVLSLCGDTLRALGYPTSRPAHEAYLREQTSLAKGRPPTTLKKKLARLRRRLKKEGEDCDDSAAE